MSLDEEVNKGWWQKTKEKISHQKNKIGKGIKTTAAITGLTILSTNYANGQKAEATLHVQDQAGRPATEWAQAQSTDTIIQEKLSNGEAYFLLKNFTGTHDNHLRGYQVYPNPSQGQLWVRIPPGQDKGTLETYDITGKLLNKTNTQERGTTLNTKPGMIILRYTTKDGRSTTSKILVNGTTNITFEQAQNQSTKKSTTSLGEDEYKFTYLGNDDLERDSTTQTVQKGEHANITLTPTYTLKDLVLNFNNIGRNVHVTTLGQEATTNEQGNANINYQERMSKHDQKQTTITYNGENVVTENINTNLSVGENNNFPHAQLTFTINYDSNRPGTTYQTKDDQGKDITGGTTARKDSIHTTTIAQDPTCQNCTPDTIRQWIKDGENNITANIQEQQQTNQFWLHDDQSSPEGANIKGWKNGAAILQANINNASYETNHLESTQENITLDSLVTTLTGYDKDLKTNYTLTPGGQRQTINLQEQTQDYHVKGKIITEDGEERFRNTINAIEITRSNGEEIYASTDQDGEFDKTIQAQPGEQLKISINIPGQRKNTLSIIYDPQKTTGEGLEYPKNRLIETSWDLYKPDSALVTPQEISEHELTIITLSQEMANNDTLKWMIEGSMNVLRGSSLYVGNAPVRKYICTTNTYLGTQMTQEEINKTIRAMNKTEALMNRPEIGPALPFEDHFTISPDKITTIEGLTNTIYMTRAGTGYWNGMLWEEPQTEPRMLGWSARGPPAILIDAYVEELIAPSARDPPYESGIPTDNYFAFETRGDTIYRLSKIGKVLMVWNNNSEPGTGQMNTATKGDWDATTHDWKTTPYLAMNNQLYQISKLESGLIAATNAKEIILPQNKTKLYNEITKQAIENNDIITAQKYVNKSLEQRTANKDALINQATLLEMTGRKEEALDTYRQAQQRTA